ncbi:MAG: AMP-binding protein [Gemmatimonadetes bacterium]|nr:AMP-binding protein [Gemmatimonadota bacterium]
MHLHHLFDAHLLGRPGAPALDLIGTESRHAITFGELEDDAARMAGVLLARGVTRGDRLALYLPNRYEYLTLFLACTRLGVIVVPINILYRERELGHILGDARPAALVVEDGAVVPETGIPIWPVSALRGDRPFEGRAPLEGDTPAALVYTSGTTGRSKGAILTHNNFLANATSLLAAWGITAADRYLATLPLFHVHGLANGVVSWLASGCRMILAERFQADQVASWFRDHRPTLFFGVPTMYHRLLQLPPGEARAIGAGMRLFVCGSAPLPAPVMAAFQEHFGHTILERYGMSETLMNIGNPAWGERRAGSVGVPFPGVSVRVVTPDGRDVPDGEVGEVWVRGPNVCAGYWDNAAATARAWTDGWFRTGDLGSRAADGYYTLHGRMSDLIISGGFNIYPREIEDVLLDQPGVTEVAVVGVADAARGELPVAYVVGHADPESLLATCRAQLASFKVPRAIVPVASLPRTALGKVQKHLLPPWS